MKVFQLIFVLATLLLFGAICYNVGALHGTRWSSNLYGVLTNRPYTPVARLNDFVPLLIGLASVLLAASTVII